MFFFCAVKKTVLTWHRLTSGGDISAEGILVKRPYLATLNGTGREFSFIEPLAFSLLE
jgi:hypothetical protein